MKLNDFKKNIPNKIYERGYEYFKEGHVTDLGQHANGDWIAEVEGNSDDYTVEITIDEKNNIRNWYCDCPFDGAICKHTVAVLLSIEEIDSPANPTKKTKRNPPEWVNILTSTPESELRSFILAYAKKHRELQNELIIKLSKSTNEINVGKYQKIIAHTFNTMSERHGYIQYGDTYAAMHPVNNLLEKADEFLQNGNIHEAFSIAAAVAPECIEAIEYMDDSNGQCGGAINEAFEIVDRILNLCKDPQLADTIYDWLHEQIQNKNYDDYGCADELEPLFFYWANNPSRVKIAYQFIDQQLKQNSNTDNWSSQYRTTKYLKYKTRLLEKEGKTAEADQLIDQNLHLSDFRKLKIAQLIKLNDYKAAIDQIKKGISQAEKENYSGIVRQFKDQLLDIYKKQNDTTNIRKTSYELFFENRDTIDYYRIYKGTFEPAEWKNECEAVIRKLSIKNGKSFGGYFFQSHLAAVYIEEKMWKNLFNEVKKANSIELTEKYSKYLKNDFSDGLILLYKNSILKYAENTGRNIYTNIVRYLKNMAKLQGGLSEAKILKDELLEQYKNRRAMKDEFKHLKWQ